MNSVSSSIVSSASNASLGSVQGAAAVAVMKKDKDANEAAVGKLLSSVTQPALATSGTLGRNVNTFA
jgi:hypothetical protein